MKIDALLKREDFYGILENTLNDYYKNIIHTDVTVKVGNNSIKNPVVVYPKLNRIIKRLPAKPIVKGIYRGFNVNDNTIKRIVAKAYITALIGSFGLLASKSISFSDISVFSSHHEICPGNKKIRINNLSTGISDVVMKKGFDDLYFRNEMSFRLNNTADYLVPVYESGENWYREKLISGVSLARITDKSLFDKSLRCALKYLGEIIDSSLRYVPGKEYAEQLKAELYAGIDRIFAEKKDLKYSRNDIEKTTEKLIEDVKNIKEIPVANSHGDFQTGNVVVGDDGKVYLIDWETYKLRSIWYDSVTSLAYTRRAGSWKKILKNKDEKYICDDIFYFDSRKNCSADEALSVLLLEDLSFRITDSLMVPGSLGCESINEFFNEIYSEVIK